MKKSKIDTLYETPSFFQKIMQYANYELRMLLWKFLDLMDYIKPKSTNSFSLNKNFQEQWTENGFLHLKGFFSTEYVDHINSSIFKTKKNLEKSRKEKNLLCGRIANIHATNRDVFKFF